MDLALEVGTDAPADVPAADEPIDALVVLNNLFRVDSFKPLLVEALIDDLRGSADVAARLIDDYYVALGVGNYGPAEGLTREACVREYPALARIVDLLVGYADV
ncbi:MAG TPA: hypothetical protein VLF67_04850, partial [Candidatus Saccharimonas sp.]|nr:hypothetical protein [Candidatus Saccharimonas sp.]